MNLFISGTDTGVGKTFVARLFLRSLRAAGIDAVAMKPICCGTRDDAELLHAAADGCVSLEEINPVWLRIPAAPYAAAKIEKRAIDLDLIRAVYARLRRAYRSILVEGVGGWRVPIARDYFVSDLAAEFGLPVAVVVANRLGAINHTLLTIDSIRARGLVCAGVILNEPAPHGEPSPIAEATNRSVLEELLEVPILFEVRHGQAGLPIAVHEQSVERIAQSRSR